MFVKQVVHLVKNGGTNSLADIWNKFCPVDKSVVWVA